MPLVAAAAILGASFHRCVMEGDKNESSVCQFDARERGHTSSCKQIMCLERAAGTMATTLVMRLRIVQYLIVVHRFVDLRDYIQTLLYVRPQDYR